MKPLLLAAFLSAAPVSFAQETIVPPAGLVEAKPDFHAITGAQAWIAPGERVNNATLVMQGGKIISIRAGGAVPAGATEIKAPGKLLLPGFIDAAGSYGLGDSNVCGSTNTGAPGAPGADAASAPVTQAKHWNTMICAERDLSANVSLDAKLAKVWQGLGFTLSVSVPKSGIWRGQAAALLIRPDQATPANSIYQSGLAQIGAMQRGAFGGYPSSTMGAIALLRQSLADAEWQHAQKDQFIEANADLQALASVLGGSMLVLMDAVDELEYQRALKIAKEFDLRMGLLGNGHEYRMLTPLKAARGLVVPLNFPAVPVVESAEAALDVSLESLEHWQMAPSNPALLAKAGIAFAITPRSLKKPAVEFPKNLQAAIERGLSVDQAIAALSLEPAKIYGLKLTGQLRDGNLANVLIADNDWVGGKGKLFEVWVAGQRHELVALDAVDFTGTYKIDLADTSAPKQLVIEKSESGLSAKAGTQKIVVNAVGEALAIYLPGKWLGQNSATVRVDAKRVGDRLDGFVIDQSGRNVAFNAVRSADVEITKADAKKSAAKNMVDQIDLNSFPAGEFGRSSLPMAANVVFRGAQIWMHDPSLKTATMTGQDVWVKDGKIRAVGVGLKVDANTQEIDAKGKHLSPGLIDAHSHIAVQGDVNEGSHTVTSEVRIGDVLDPTDINIYRQLAGGVTTAHLLHGSANTIGGQSQVIKLRWGQQAEALKFTEASRTIKFALGENPKQANWGDNFQSRYPQTRMGVEQLLIDSFQQAKTYAAMDPKTRRRDLRLEAIAEILQGKRMIHAHSYRQDEILMLARLTQALGIKIAAFQHVLEGYKVADVLAQVGAGASTFADWWAFKAEVFDAIPYNAAMMMRAGVVTSLNSDSPDTARRLNTEAAKTMRFGKLSAAQALALVTINPAKQLRVDQLVGSIEAGKQADLVLWSAQPLSARARVLQTWIDGKLYFDLPANDAELERITAKREALIQLALPERVKALAETTPKVEAKKAVLMSFRTPRAWPAIMGAKRGPYHDGEPVHICTGE